MTPPDPRIGIILQGRYAILERVASGAMGVVYRGERIALGRAVAVKFLHPWIAAQQTFRTRFETEARAMSRLSHPNCASVIDFGLEGTSPYVVMDFIPGITLRQLLEKGRLAPPRAVTIAKQVLAGVSHAHSQNIVHRDLKPENLILGDTAGLTDHVRILDFGLAKLRDGPAQTSGLALGTPSYMSPEQTGSPGEIDGRTDIYAVGVLTFEMLAGRKPFIAEKVAEVLVMHRDTPPPKLRQFVPDAGISAQLEAAVDRALAKSPHSRFQTAAAFSEALQLVPEAMANSPSGGHFPVEVARRAPVQIGPALPHPVDETTADPEPLESAVPMFVAPGKSAAAEPTGTKPNTSRVWTGLGALSVLALILVAVGIRGRSTSRLRGTAAGASVSGSAVAVEGDAGSGFGPGHEIRARPEAPAPRPPTPNPIAAATPAAAATAKPDPNPNPPAAPSPTPEASGRSGKVRTLVAVPLFKHTEAQEPSPTVRQRAGETLPSRGASTAARPRSAAASTPAKPARRASGSFFNR